MAEDVARTAAKAVAGERSITLSVLVERALKAYLGGSYWVDRTSPGAIASPDERGPRPTIAIDTTRVVVAEGEGSEVA